MNLAATFQSVKKSWVQNGIRLKISSTILWHHHSNRMSIIYDNSIDQENDGNIVFLFLGMYDLYITSLSTYQSVRGETNTKDRVLTLMCGETPGVLLMSRTPNTSLKKKKIKNGYII